MNRRLTNNMYIPMPPHSKCNGVGKDYDIISCRTITKTLAKKLLDNQEFSNGVDTEALRRAGIEDNSTWWYNNVEDMVMIKGRSGRYYIKKTRVITNREVPNAYQIACDNYSVISEYVARKKRN